MKDELKPIRTKTDYERALGKRSLSLRMIRRLHDQLGISAEVLIRPSRTGKAA